MTTSEKKHLYIFGRPVETVFYRGHRCRLLDIDKKERTVQIQPPGKQPGWYPYAEVIHDGHTFVQIGNNNIGLTARSGSRKSKTTAPLLAAAS